MTPIDVLLDAASRPLEALGELRGHVTPAVLNAHPGGHDNSVAWLLWHTGREVDVQLARLSSGAEVWSRDGFRERLALGKLGDGVGYGHTPEQARAIVVQDSELLADYVAATLRELSAYIRTLDSHSLEEVVDRRWTPHVTRSVRLVSIIDDAAQHLAQAAYVCGMPPAAPTDPFADE